MNPSICPTCLAPIPPAAPGGFCPACLLRDAEEPIIAGRGAPSPEEIAAAFPKLDVVRFIGQGGMGSVYQARQPGLDRTVALKILSPELGRDPAFAERFSREARALGKLNHPNIVTVFEHGESGGFFYLLMEFVDGVNLRQAMRAGRFTPEQALAIVPGICDALQTAHAQGIWHRDIKPENILLDARGGVKIADFGIARIAGDPHRDFTLTVTGGMLGSAAYMAPEQHETPRNVDHRADIYSLGVVIYEMLTGELPLGRFPAPSRRAAVNARIDAIVFRTLEKERELRQQSADEVKTDVQGAAAHSHQSVAVPGSGEEKAGGTRFPFIWAVASMAGGLLFHLMGTSLSSSHETAAITISIIGRLGILTGVMITAFTAYRLKPSKWTAGLGGFIVLAAIVVLGTGLSNRLFILGLLAATAVIWVGASLLEKPPQKPADVAGPTSKRMKTKSGHGKLTFALSFFVLALAGAPLFAAFLGKQEIIAVCGTLLLSSLILGLTSWREPLGKFVAIASCVLLIASPVAIVWSQVIEAKAALQTWETAVVPQPAVSHVDDRSTEPGPETVLRWLRTSIVEGKRTHWKITFADGEVIDLAGKLEAERMSGSGFTGLVVHVDENPVFMVVGKMAGGFFKWQSNGRGLEGMLDDLDFSITDGDKAMIGKRSYDLTRGRVFVVRADGSLRQIAKRPERVIPGEKLQDFVAALPPEPLPDPGEMMKRTLNAARNRNARVFQEGLSTSFKAEAAKDGETHGFGDFGNCHWISTTKVDETHAESVVEADDGSKRRFTFRMVFEDGAWKVDGLGYQP